MLYLVQVVAQTPPNDINANQLFILSIALALSTYVSTVSREVTQSLKKSRGEGKGHDIREKQVFLFILILGDVLLWLGILLPLLINIGLWFLALTPPFEKLTLTPQQINIRSFFGTLRPWLMWGIGLTAGLMFVAHFLQWITQISWTWEQSLGNTFEHSPNFRNRLDAIVKEIHDSPSNSVEDDQDILYIFLNLSKIPRDENSDLLLTKKQYLEIVKATDETRWTKATDRLIALSILKRDGNGYLTFHD